MNRSGADTRENSRVAAQAWRREEAGENPARSRHCDRVLLRPEARNSLATNPSSAGRPIPRRWPRWIRQWRREKADPRAPCADRGDALVRVPGRRAAGRARHRRSHRAVGAGARRGGVQPFRALPRDRRGRRADDRVDRAGDRRVRLRLVVRAQPGRAGRRAPCRHAAVDGRSGQRAPRRREPARVHGACGRVARRAGAPGRHVPRDHPRRRRQGCGRARARGADRGVLARRLRAAGADRAARPSGPLDADERQRAGASGPCRHARRGVARHERRRARRRLCGGRGLRRSAPVSPRRGLREGRAGRRARRLCAEPDARRALRVRARGLGGARRRAERPCRPAHCTGTRRRPGRRHLGGARRAVAGGRGAQARPARGGRRPRRGTRGAALPVRPRPRRPRYGRA